MSKTMRVSLRALLLAAVLPTAFLYRMQGQQIAEDDPTIRVNVELVQLDVQVLQPDYDHQRSERTSL